MTTSPPQLAPQDTGRVTGTGAAHTSLKSFLGDWAKRARSGESGVLPVVAGLVLIVIVFQVQSPVFLSAGNLTNLLVQGAVFVLLGMAEVFVLLLGEIDLSIGYLAGIGAVVTGALLAYPYQAPWWVAIAAGLVVTSALGALQGTLITRLGLPSFVVTLSGLLGFEGLMILMIDNSGSASGGTIRITDNVVNDLVNGNLSPLAGWLALAAVLVVYGAVNLLASRRRRASGLVAVPPSVAIAKVAVTAAAGVVLVWICNTNRGALVPLRGVPWVVPIVLGVFVAWTALLGRTRFGRYIYAIGGNAEAARRAGVNLTRVRTLAFTLSGLTSGAAGVIYASRLGSISVNIDGGTLVLYAVAAAVIGGTSLFGGRGKVLHAVLGGLVIAAIYNGMGLLGMGAAVQYMVTALVLLAAVTVDAVARRNRRAA
ncbi:MAG: ABC transporter permease [Actinomycetota bacterium]|nr:ABC transporter permease [Actinomycetota bacterium]